MSSQGRVPYQPAPDLPTLNPQPLQFDFPQHPIEDRPDEWFVEEFRQLFRRMEKFFDEYFWIKNLNEGEIHQLWALNHTPEFLNYVLEVAAQDPAQGGWDKLLRDTVQRKWLLMGILMMILQVKVFHEDLLGANKEEKELMFAIEKATFTQEGFSRTNLRSETVKTILGPGPVTEDFHSEVARLTAQVSLLFKPLSDYLYAIPPPEGKTTPLIWDQYQSLHNIIATAAYLSLCIRLSPTIFYFTPLLPNEGYQPDEQHCLETESFEASKKKIVDEYTAVVTEWNEERMRLKETAQTLTDQNIIDEPSGVKAREDLAAHIKACPEHLGATHRALCKIGVWPNIRQFKPGSEKEEKARCVVPLEEKTGFRIYEISKSVGVFYFGLVDRMEREKQRVCLKGLVADKQKQYGKSGTGASVVPYAIALALAAFPFVVLRTLPVDFWVRRWLD